MLAGQADELSIYKSIGARQQKCWSHLRVWYVRVSKKVLYETPYAVTGGVKHTGLEKAPKPI